MKRRISVTVFIYFATALSIFAIITSGIFSTLFQKHVTALNVDQLEESSVRIAQTVSEIWEEQERQEAKSTASESGSMRGKSSRMMRHHSSSSELQTYVDFMKDSALADIWIIDADLDVAASQSQTGMKISDMPLEVGDIMDATFNGETVYGETLSAYLGQRTITIGTPIFAVDGEVIGAVLAHAPVKDFNHTLLAGLEVLGLSLLFSLPLAAFLSWFMSQKLTKPIKQMSTTTQKLQQGAYQIRTNITRSDELGALAVAIDDLALQLTIAEEKQQALEKMRQTFITNISHELRTPVTVMRSSLEALHDGVVSDQSDVENYHEKLLAESVYLQKLVNDLLELSKLQSYDFSIEREQINMYDVLTDVKRSMQQLAGQKEIVITLEDAITTIPYAADYNRCRQMFITILDNAIKFSPEKAEIAIKVEQATDYTMITITDQGPGIPDEQQDILFDRFHRNTDEQNKQGSGLGLAIAKEIARRHDIVISITSTDAGTSFHFQLPNTDI